MIDISRRDRVGRPRALALGVAAASGLLLLAGCGPSTSSAQSGGDQPQTQQSQQGQRYGTRQPGVSGEIAEIDGSTMQVQGSSEQTAVTWTSSTTFTEQVTSDRSAITVGSCVIIRSADTSSSASPATQIAAEAVSLVPASNGSCSAFGGMRGQGGGPGGMPSDLPSGAPTGMPSAGMPSGAPNGGMPGGAPNAGAARPVAGKVTSVSGSSFTVEVTEPTGGASPNSTSSSTPSNAPGTRAVTVTTTSDTAVTARKTTTSKAAKVGLCANAQGKTDSTGALTATSVALSAKTDGSCSQGFGRNGGTGSGTGSGTGTASSEPTHG